MAKIHVQSMPEVLQYSGSLAANGSISGSAYCNGYAKLVGWCWSSCTSETASGLRIHQSVDSGSNWEIVSASDALTADASAACGVDIIGNAVKVEFKMGAAAACGVRAIFQLRPV